MRLIDEIAYQYKIAKIPMEERTFVKAWETAQDMPTIDAVPVVRGEWIQKHHIISLDNVTLTGTYPTCNLCGYAWLGVAKNTNYCPNCGAKMEDKPCG